MQFFYSATNGSDTGSVVAFVSGNEATANLSDLLPATTYTVYGVVTATNGSTPQSSSTTFTTEGARTDHAAWYELPARTTADETITQTVYPASGSQRNYTMYYDKSTYTAYWVAYPLAKGHMGNGRSDKWQRNPGLAESEQINVWSSSYGVNLGATTSDGYDSSKEFYAGGIRYPTPTATVRTNWSYRPITQPIPRRRFRTNSTAVFGSSSKAASEISLRLRTRYMW